MYITVWTEVLGMHPATSVSSQNSPIRLAIQPIVMCVYSPWPAVHKCIYNNKLTTLWDDSMTTSDGPMTIPVWIGKKTEEEDTSRFLPRGLPPV